MPAELGTRRSLHIHYAKFLLPVSLSSAIAAALIVLILFPIGLIVVGIIFCGAILLYYGFIHFFNFKLPKELVAAIGYTIGCWLPALHFGFFGNAFHLGYLLILLHALAAFANLISYSIIDKDEDLEIGMISTLSIERLNRYRVIIPAITLVFTLAFIIAGIELVLILPIIIVTALQTLLPYFSRDSLLARIYGENFFTILFVSIFFQ